MNAEEDAILALQDSGLLDVLIWAAPTAFAVTDQIFDEDAGHDQGVVGYLNFKHLVNMIDRATSNGRYALGSDVDGAGTDIVERGITQEAVLSMPQILPGVITRCNFRQSPGWAVNGYRVLLQSFTFGRVDNIKWVLRSDAKRRVAAQVFITQDTLFDDADFGLEFLQGVPDDADFTGITLVVAHAFNPITKQYEFYVGQSKNPEYPGDACWHWRRLLLAGGSQVGGVIPVGPSLLPGDAASADADEISVRIKRPSTGEGFGVANG